MRVEPLSSGYYLTELYVETGVDAPRINDHNYRELQQTVHRPGSEEWDIIFHVDSAYFTVEPSRSIPVDTVALPEEAIEMLRVANPPSLKEILIPKPWLFRYLREPVFQRSEAL